MPTYEQVARPLDMAHTLFEDATLAANAAMDARTGGEHSAAGIWREAERSALQRAKVLATIAQADALDRIADVAAQVALNR